MPLEATEYADLHMRWMIRRDMPEVLKIENANFELVIRKSFIRSDQKYFRTLYRIFPFEVIKPNIFIVAKKTNSI